MAWAWRKGGRATWCERDGVDCGTRRRQGDRRTAFGVGSLLAAGSHGARVSAVAGAMADAAADGVPAVAHLVVEGEATEAARMVEGDGCGAVSGR